MKKILLIFVFFVFLFVTSCAPVVEYDSASETANDKDYGICTLVGHTDLHYLYRCVDSHAVCYLFGDNIECFDILGK